jgi:hypothetical protein
MRMSGDDFDHLLDLLRPSLQVNEQYARNATPNGALVPEQRLALTLKFLGGEVVESLLDIFKVARPTVYMIVWSTLAAINSCKALQLHMDVSAEVRSPSSSLSWFSHSTHASKSGFAFIFPCPPLSLSLYQACKRRALEFKARSKSEGVFCACAGCIDGLLVRTKCPSATDVPNPRGYWSGHKKEHGINMQGVCDAYCRFLAVTYNNPGACPLSFQFCMHILVDTLSLKRLISGRDRWCQRPPIFS